MPTVPQTNRDQVTSKDRAPVGDGSVLGPTPDGGGPVNPGAHDLSELSGADDVQAIEALTGTGLLTRTTTNAWALRSLTAPAAGLTISNPAGIAGNPTFALADDLAVLEALTGTGYLQRTGDDAWSILSSIPAEDVSYDPTTSGLTATDVQAALDELAAMTGGDAADITFDPSATDLLSTNVQDAIGELDLIVQGKADISSLAAVAFSGAATDVVVSSPNLSSTDVGSALDELFGLIGGNPFDQDLNTTDSPSFAGETLSGQLLIDSASGALPTEIFAGSTKFKMAGTDSGLNVIEALGWNNAAFNIVGRLAGGTRASPSASPDAFNFFAIGANGHNGTAYVALTKGQYTMVADGTWSSTNNGLMHLFYGTPNGSTSLAEWLRLQNGWMRLPPVTGPIANPAIGFWIYVDSADNKLKVRGVSGTVTTLANP